MSDTFGVEFVSGTWALKIEDLRPLWLEFKVGKSENPYHQKKSAVNEKGLDTARMSFRGCGRNHQCQS